MAVPFPGLAAAGPNIRRAEGISSPQYLRVHHKLGSRGYLRFMSYRVLRLGVPLVLTVVLLWGCSSGPNFVAQDEPWRKQEEITCLSRGTVRESAFIHARSALGGPSEYCGAERPFEIAAADGGRVALAPAALVACPMIPQIDLWVASVVEPAARRNLGGTLTELRVAASYSCRPMNNVDGARLSEHGHANAIDISAFKLTDGRTVTVKGGWNGTAQEQAFLREVRANSCQTFTTVLGPGADSHHDDHFHLDLARHGRDGQGRVCR